MSEPADEDELGPIGAFHRHEVLHTASIVAELFERHVSQHRFTKNDVELSAEAERVTAALWDFYQLVGNRT